LKAPSFDTHDPSMQLSTAVQALPHPPQLFGSVFSLTQPTVGQQLSPGAHAGPPLQVVCTTQAPATHASPTAHGLPQRPQFFGSVSTSEQPVAQHWSVPVHTGPPLHEAGAVQFPVWQVSPGGQRRLHRPQFLGSVSTFAHPDVQHCLPPVQTGPPLHDVGATQLPFWQVSPIAHWNPHSLQLLGSFWTSTQPPGQQVESVPVQGGPPMQPVLAQLPPTQVAPGGHARKHPPQLFGSVCVSTHDERFSCWQQVSGAAQGRPIHVVDPWHAPPTHFSPGRHSLLQRPQLFGSVCSSTQF
jgi:hypothetical protein